MTRRSPRDRSARRWAALACGLLLLGLGVFAAPAIAVAEAPPPAPASNMAATPAPSTQAPPPVPVIAPEQLDALVQTLENGDARARLIDQLKALQAASRATQPAPPEPRDVLPDAVGQQAFAQLAGGIGDLARHFVRVADVFADLPRVGEWALRQGSDPVAVERWRQIGLDLAAMTAAGLVGAGLLALATRRPIRALESRRPERFGTRLGLLGLRALLRLGPWVAFAVIAFVVLEFSEPGPRVRLAVMAAWDATIIIAIARIATDALFAPGAPGLRLLNLGDLAAARAAGWIDRLALVGVAGAFIAEAAYVLGLPLGAYGALLKLLGVGVALMVVAMILQSRAGVAAWLDGHPLSGDGDREATLQREARGQGAVLRQAREHLADVWHLLAIAYVVVAFGAWILNVYDGFTYLARATLVSLAAFAAARMTVGMANRRLVRLLDSSHDRRHRLAHLHARAAHYEPGLRRLIKLAIWALAIPVILQAWGIDALAWMDTAFGQRLVRSATTIGLILIFAVIAWEVVNALIERFLAGERDLEGGRVERSARVRTLLPLLRNAFLVVLVTMVSLISLAELGVNIAPLLAGAGVIGLAVGFGSQTLVKDVITGLFILFEDTIAVGDVVDVGNGHSGVVEAISIRTIRLRDMAGSVHSVPFSAVTTVKNLTKDFSYAVFNVNVDYDEDPDHVGEVLRALGNEMVADPAFAADILAPLEVLGVDKFADSAVIIVARFKTRPLKQWSVGREFNKRMKKRFHELQIAVPSGQMRLVVSPEGPRP